ncbi:hypothetical protein DBV15_09964 [Temnothorax longispinosus]|uniref:Uncharacterized protein n=1 Tax=Temnothorax longispinosus TaxID=300112 RepID=A0A4V6RGH1_9HYME|nr:hypothetical protein DBV15_09964 [Temnothorax longispinosus]
MVAGYVLHEKNTTPDVTYERYRFYSAKYGVVTPDGFVYFEGKRDAAPCRASPPTSTGYNFAIVTTIDLYMSLELRAKKSQGRTKFASRSTKTKRTNLDGPGDENEGHTRDFRRRADFRLLFGDASPRESLQRRRWMRQLRTGSQRDQRHRVRRNAR